MENNRITSIIVLYFLRKLFYFLLLYNYVRDSGVKLMFWVSKKQGYEVYSSERSFYASIDKYTSLAVIKEDSHTIFILKKDLVNYKIHVHASEAPMSNILSSEQEPWETVIAHSEILEKEVFPLVDILKKVFGKSKKFKLKLVRLCVGSDFTDYVTIDESDLTRQGVDPSLEGLKTFFQANKDIIIGFMVRKYDPRQGNLTFLECLTRYPAREIYSLKLTILTNIAQRGTYTLKYQKPFGLQKYIIIDAKEITEKIIKLLFMLGVNWSTIILRRSYGIKDWTKAEVQEDENKLRNFLKVKYPQLASEDIEQILRAAEEHGLSFEGIVLTAEILTHQKSMKDHLNEYEEFYPSKIDITAAVSLAADLCGAQRSSNMKVDPRVEERKKEFIKFFDKLLGLHTES